AQLNALKTIRTSPLNKQQGEWGVAMMNIRDDSQPGTMFGAPTIFVLYGDVRLDNASPTSTLPSPCTAVTKGTTEIRSRPEAGGPKIESLGAQTSLNITGRLEDSAWLLIKSGNSSGWIVAQDLQVTCANINNVPVILPGDATVGTDVPGTLSRWNVFF